jgi:DNA-binding NarL/FixJ family response regulator
MNILIVDDEKLFTELIKDYLLESNFNVFHTNKYNETIENIVTNNIDVVLLDLFFPDQKGIEVLKSIQSNSTLLPVIILSSNFEPRLIRKSFENGALGYLTKNVSKQELLDCVNSVTSGNRYLCGDTQNSLIKFSTYDEIKGLPLTQKITKKEMEILNLISEGFTTNQISEKLFISVRTVETHRNNLMQKFNTNRIGKLVRTAFENNIL